MSIPITHRKIFVVIPAYQAEKTLKHVFSRLPEELEKKDITYLIVNDGSTDGTQRVAEEVVARRPNVRLVNHETNMGYAQAQKTAFEIALREGAEIVALLHADGQYPPELLPDLLLPLEKGEADLVMGSRMLNSLDALKGGMPIYKWLANKILTLIENLAYGLRQSEYHSGYMIYSRETLKKVPFHSLSNTFHFDGEMLMMSGKKGLRIIELSIPTHYGDEESHLRPINYGFNVLRIVVKYLMGKYGT